MKDSGKVMLGAIVWFIFAIVQIFKGAPDINIATNLILANVWLVSAIIIRHVE